MAEEILSLDEAKKIAEDYVRQKEQLVDVTIEGEKLSTVGGLLLYEFKGKVRRHAMTKDFCDAVIAERSFEVQILVKNRTILYSPSAWIEKSFEQGPPPSYQPEPSMIPPDEIFNFEDIRRDRQIDRDLKESEIERNKAQARLAEERAKKERQAGGKSSDSLGELARKYGLDPTRFRP